MKKTPTEEKILLSAKKVFYQKGLKGARMQEIADDAGVNKAMLHYYFRSKDKLFDKVFEAIQNHSFGRDVDRFISQRTLFVQLYHQRTKSKP